jgi:head-tail adaptor
MLTPTEQRDMQATSEEAMPDWASIHTPIVANDDGDAIETWQMRWRGKARVGPMGGGEQVFSDAVKDLCQWIVTLPSDCGLTTRERIIIGNRTLDVVSVAAPRSWQLAVRAACVEVR